MADIRVQAKSQSVNSGIKLRRDLHNLLDVLGQSEVQVLPNGSAFNVYKNAGALEETQVAEGAEITPSSVKMELDHTAVIDYKKYINYTGIESIGKFGYDVAVGGTNEAMLRDIQKAVRASIITALASGTSTSTSAKGSDFQQQLADTWAKLAEVTEDEAGTAIYFTNPADVSGWLGKQQIVPSTAFGLTYLDTFFGKVIVDSNVTAGTVYGTLNSNLTLVAADVRGIAGLDCYTDETGIIAIHNGAAHDHGAIETFMATGTTVQPVVLSRIVKNTVAA